MDNLTHSLVGMAAAKAGLERLSPGATAFCIVAANIPDSDIAVALFGDRWTYLQHHRGITHAIVGVVSLAILLPVLFYLGDFLISKIRRKSRQVNVKGLLLCSLVVTATHPLLDWTNNYGIRFFLPWDSSWSYGDLLFIIDPFIWFTLGGACFLLTSHGAVQKFLWITVGAVVTLLIMVSPRATAIPSPWLFRGIWIGALVVLIVLLAKGVGGRIGPKLAVVSLLVVCCYLVGLAFLHSRAITQAHSEASELVETRGEQVSKLAAMPTPANPFGWDCVFETEKATYRFTLSMLQPNKVSRVVRYEKPTGQLRNSVNEVASERSVRTFLGFARFPVARLASESCVGETLLQFADLRYTEPGARRGTFSLDLPVECPEPVVTEER